MPEVNSRYRNTPLFIVVGSNGHQYYGTRTPIEFADSPDTTVHIVKDGDTLHKLANVHYQGFPNPSSLWWVIAEFQKTPIIDPTVKLEPGALLNIPSPNLVSTLINTESIDKVL